MEVPGELGAERETRWEGQKEKKKNPNVETDGVTQREQESEAKRQGGARRRTDSSYGYNNGVSIY